MEYQKIINLLDNKSNQLSKFRTKNGLKQMVNQEKYIIPIVTLDSRLQYLNLVYVIIVILTYLLKEE